MGGGFDEVSRGRKIEARARRAERQRAAEIERCFIDRSVGGFQSKSSVGSIMRRQLPRRFRRRSGRATQVDRRTERGLDRLPCDCAGAQQLRSIGETRDDRRFKTMAGRPCVKDPVDLAVEIGKDMSGGSRAHAARAIGGGRGEGDARRLDERASRFVRGRAKRHGVETGARQQADPAGRAHGQDQRERPGPECAGELFGLGAERRMLSRRLDAETWAMSGSMRVVAWRRISPRPPHPRSHPPRGHRPFRSAWRRGRPRAGMRRRRRSSRRSQSRGGSFCDGAPFVPLSRIARELDCT